MAKKSAKKKSTVNTLKKVILAIAIIIVLTSFIQVGISTFYERPEYKDHCKEVPRPILIEKDGEILEKAEYNETYYRECQEGFDSASQKYSGIVFWFSLILGLVIFIVGVFIKFTPVATGLMGAGAITIFIGITQNWRYFEQYMKFIILGLILMVLLWLGYKKLNK